MRQERSRPADHADIAGHLHSAAIGLLRTLRKRDSSMGLSPARASVLSILVFAGPRTLTQLAEAEQVAAPTMTKLVAGLERDGLVRRKADPSDGRAWLIHAAPKARALLQRGRRERLQLLLRLLKDASNSDWRILEEAATVLERALTPRADAGRRP